MMTSRIVEIKSLVGDYTILQVQMGGGVLLWVTMYHVMLEVGSPDCGCSRHFPEEYIR